MFKFKFQKHAMSVETGIKLMGAFGDSMSHWCYVTSWNQACDCECLGSNTPGSFFPYITIRVFVGSGYTSLLR